MPCHLSPDTYIREYPGSGPTIVLLHGFLKSKTYWRRIIPQLRAANYRIIAIDLLGFGNAPKPSTIDYSYDDHLAHIKTAFTQAGLDAPFFLVGHSMGALLALRYANQYPEEVRALCLLHPPIYETPHEVMQTLRATSYMYRFLLDSRYREIGWFLFKLFRMSSPHSQYSREASFHNVIVSAMFLNDLKKNCHRTLMTVGTRDRAAYRKNLPRIKPVPHLTIVVEKTGHHSPITRPRWVGATMLRFLQQSR